MLARERARVRKEEERAFTALLLAEKHFGADSEHARAVRAYWLGKYELAQILGVYGEIDGTAEETDA